MRSSGRAVMGGLGQSDIMQKLEGDACMQTCDLVLLQAGSYLRCRQAGFLSCLVALVHSKTPSFEIRTTWCS